MLYIICFLFSCYALWPSVVNQKISPPFVSLSSVIQSVPRKPTILCSHFLCSHPRGHCFAHDLLHLTMDTHSCLFISATTPLLHTQTYMHPCTRVNIQTQSHKTHRLLHHDLLKLFLKKTTCLLALTCTHFSKRCCLLEIDT